MKFLNRWNYKTHKYDKVKVPEADYIVYTDNMEQLVTCPHCGKKIIYGNAYTSLEFHNCAGFGYPVCEKCYKKEWIKRRETKGL